jgi:hypothetical protein
MEHIAEQLQQGLLLRGCQQRPQPPGVNRHRIPPPGRGGTGWPLKSDMASGLLEHRGVAGTTAPPGATPLR